MLNGVTNDVTKRFPVWDHTVQRAFPLRKQNGDERAGVVEVFVSRFLVWVHKILSPCSFILVSVTGKCIAEIFSEIHVWPPALDR